MTFFRNSKSSYILSFYCHPRFRAVFEFLRGNNTSIVALTVLILGFSGCKDEMESIQPLVITQKTNYDSDDPAIWVNSLDPSASVIFGTDKNTDGAVYAFDLKGNILEEMTIRGLKRPNNVDVEYGLRINDSTLIDIIAITEREAQSIRVYSIPDMRPIDGGGFTVFEDETSPEMRLPMGIGIYKSVVNGKIYIIVGRKTGPLENYLYQYLLSAEDGKLQLNFVRKFGNFSGKYEIEALAIDDRNGFVYYADEGICIRKYYAEPTMGNRELACFGGEYFKSDIEGIALLSAYCGNDFLIASDQQRGSFNVFNSRNHSFIKAINLGTTETDGCDAVSDSLSPVFNKGLFAAMNDNRDYYLYNLEDLGLCP